MNSIFIAALGLYCVTSFLFINSPIILVSYFLFFRAAFAMVPYVGGAGFAGEPYFLSALICFSLQCIIITIRGFRYIHVNRVFFWFLIFLAVVLVTSAANVIFGSSARQGIDDLTKIVIPLFAYPAIYVGIRDDNDLIKAVKCVLITSFIPILTGLAQAFMGVGYQYSTGLMVAGLRPAGTIVDPNLYGIYLSLMFFLTLPVVVANKSRSTLLYMIVLAGTIVLARNRGTWIALALSMMVAVPMFGHRLRVRNWAIGAMVLVILASPIVIARFDDLNGNDQWGQSKDTGAGRFKHHLELLEKALDNPIIGTGPGSSVVYWGAPTGGVELKLPPHNDYVRCVVEFGFFSAIIYLMFFFSQLMFTIAHKRDRLWQYQLAACGGQIYLIIISVVQNVLTDICIYTLVLFLAAISHRAAELSRSAGEVPICPPITRKPLERPVWIGPGPR